MLQWVMSVLRTEKCRAGKQCAAGRRHHVAAISGVTGHMEDVHLQRNMGLLGQKNSLVGLTGVP
jgi:hypothetical protein